jgi:LPS-assembly protein
VMVRLQDFQTLDEVNLTEADFPYRRVPQVTARAYWPRGPLGLEYTFDSEITYFHRDVGVTGLRTWVQPELTLPLEYRGVSLRSSAGLDLATYQLNNVDFGGDDRPGRSLPWYSVDLSTVLERLAGREGRWLQTLEPRIQFVHVPFEDQDDLPAFDTIDPDINIVQLFRRNRFVGLDRLGDTDQLSLGVTTRLLRARDGSQFLTATLGETLYFSSRDVQLDGKPPSDDNSSDYIAELGMNFNGVWNVDLGYQWDSDESVTRLAEARVLYRPDDYRIVSMSYRYRRDTLREIDIAAAWPLWDRWSIVGRFDYSLEDREPLERFLGIEYDTCCWGLRLVARRNLATREGDSDTSVTLQLVLKGFGSRGSPAERLLGRGILGYDRFDRY